jgi:hypothetical protein
MHDALLPPDLPPGAEQGEQIPESMALRSCPPLPRSTRISMRSLSISPTLSAATSATLRPAP